MRHLLYRRLGFSLVVLFWGALWLPACNSSPGAGGGGKVVDGKDGNTLVSETINHFRTQTYTARLNISKVYKNNLRYDDVLRVYSKVDGNDRVRVLLLIKPQGERKGGGMLAEVRDREIVSAYRLIPETKRVVEMNPRQDHSNVVIGGLALEDFQILQGVSPFAEVSVAGKEEAAGRQCYKLNVTFKDQTKYQWGELFTTVEERLPVLLRAYGKDGAPVKEVSFDRVERAGENWVVKQLTVSEKEFDYTSTFTFDDVRINPPIEDSTFAVESLGRGWREDAD